MSEFLHLFVDGVIEFVAGWGYGGIFVMMFVESSFVPFPSEVAMIPAGYLAQQGRMNAGLAILASTAGSLGGAFLNYQLALHLGLPILKKVGRYFLIRPEHFTKAEIYFRDHGEVTTFVGRLIPGIRQLISVPAGVAKMHLAKFFFYTGLGAGLWSAILVVIGYQAGAHEDLWRPMLNQITLWLLIGLVLLIGMYVIFHRVRKAKISADTEDAS